MAYVYRHIRLDKNVVFYVGIGSDDLGNYTRANEKKGRSLYWNKIVEKSKGYEIEIIIDGVSWGFACKKEQEFISIYKRRKDGGTLCNMTLGGEGKLGVRPTNAFKKGQPANNKGKPMPKHQLEILIRINKGRTPWNKGISPSIESIAKANETKKRLGIHKGEKHPAFGKPMLPHVKEALRISNIDRPVWNTGKKMSNEWVEANKLNKPAKGVILMDLAGVVLMEFRSLRDAADWVGSPKTTMSHAIRDGAIHRQKYRLKYKNEVPTKIGTS